MVDAPDLKSVGPQGLWGFKSPHPHQSPAPVTYRDVTVF